MANFVRPLGFILLGGIAGAGAAYWLASETATAPASAEKKPLYWVSPMDASFRSDKPGKSPMGMDLVPVYEDSGSADDSPGTVRVAPNIVNNLGVRTDEAIRGQLPSNIITVGYVQYNEDELYHMHPRVEGWIEKLYVKSEGDPVEKGKPVYTLYSPTLVNAQEELLLALDRKNPRLIRAAEERLSSLNVSDRLIRTLRKTRNVQRTITFYAPASGVIDVLRVREGTFVRPGDPVMSIGSLDEVWVIGEVFESQLWAIRTGDPVEMTLDYMPGRRWMGRVDYVYPEINLETRTAQVRMRFDNTDGMLQPGMFASVNMQGDPSERRTLVPRESVIRTGQSDRVVLALEEGAFKSVNVTTGRVGDKYAEILEGVVPGDRVVVSAQFLIDSESSKTSDFRRMSPPSAGAMDPDMNHSGHTMEAGKADAKDSPEAMNHEGMDPSAMDQSEMDQSEMDQSEMDQSEMDQSEMDHGKMDHDGGAS
ncbi:efflux RND transporter periplasmic adaptor subunit [Marinobacter sp. Arc7-DN-1]|uniref:efflux RND transporter periplasmic adaptor subunit n=1 Tax=Marinobacter sp. Arc7-DN-1 TaxID=2304594 RepID=UPI000E435FBE|nr:efflux RND transporter periplasmic adaptor subunit [Marinobacter sp. Arc7-DN-1]AXS83050.1 efflux RND transporter periplasmic adaptor subunit [Marinobacter sp. Arc7-DN-1]